MRYDREAMKQAGRNFVRGMWLHQLAEYAIGFSMIVAGAQRPSPVPLALGGALVVANAAIVIAPFSPFRWVGARLHFTLDWIVLIVLLGIAWVDDDSTTRVMLACYAIALGALVWVFRPREETSRRG